MDAGPGADHDTCERFECTDSRFEYYDKHSFHYVSPGIGTRFDVNRDDAAYYSTDANGQTGLQRTDNNMELTSWPQVNMINQKNYYT